ncbi:hypothetical protein [Seohaeicola zhoushanensis]|uniref:Uncharacterized protein n=1 Tax=Seohaeicola zhoushanensis TaxID=1569283 RepID=A0A8J3H352_9RHOB|nr:hypothetical protein [Seohaeicola zhoushanensis]GHF71266.1 hypothetical protein GCM10017056_47730 [Seohaeicola zhoushanensis]
MIAWAAFGLSAGATGWIMFGWPGVLGAMAVAVCAAVAELCGGKIFAAAGRFLRSPLGRWALLALVVAAFLGWWRWDAWRDARRAQELRDYRQHIQTRERIDDAISDPRTPADIAERLRRLAQ